MPLERGLCDTDRTWFGDWEQHLLRPREAAETLLLETGLSKPHFDDVLRRDGREYGRVLAGLFERGLIDFSTPAGVRADVGVFFVKKGEEGEQLRIIIDTRMSNAHFVPPRSTKLPSPAAFSQIDITADNGKSLKFVHADIENAFYGMAIPEGLSQYFGLPGVQDKWLLDAGVPASAL